MLIVVKRAIPGTPYVRDDVVDFPEDRARALIEANYAAEFGPVGSYCDPFALLEGEVPESVYVALKEHFTPEELLAASMADLTAIPGIGPKRAEAVLEAIGALK